MLGPMSSGRPRGLILCMLTWWILTIAQNAQD